MGWPFSRREYHWYHSHKINNAISTAVSYTPIGIAIDLVTGNDNPVVTALAPIVAPIVAAVVPAPPPAEPCEGSWGAYGACSKTCGSGTQTSTWTTTKNPAHGGTACPNPTTYSQACNTQACPIDCVGSWSDYGACSKTCGSGTQTSTWETTTASAHSGTACPSPTTKSQACNTQACPIDCVGSWSDYTPCNEPCGGGTQTRSWTTLTNPAHGGTACPSPTAEIIGCNTLPCLTSTGPSTGPSAGPSADSTDNDNKLYIVFGSILSVCCCMLVTVLILSMSGKPPPRGRFRR